MSSVLVKRVSFFQKIGKKYQKNFKKYFSHWRRTKKGAETGMGGVFSFQCLIFSSKIHDSIQNQQWNSNIGFSEGKDSICGIRNRNRPTDLNLGRKIQMSIPLLKHLLAFAPPGYVNPLWMLLIHVVFPGANSCRAWVDMQIHGCHLKFSKKWQFSIKKATRRGFRGSPFE